MYKIVHDPAACEAVKNDRAGPATGAKRSLPARGNYTRAFRQIKFDNLSIVV